ncbi:MAG: hypothetical protein SV375_18745 [Thermodesulfobacteriota bacterium]|nr:hypothetical protein [Thermodesulfobacteriota bacterium]
MRFLKSIGTVIKSIVGVLWGAFDIRDVFVLGGLAMLGYGLHLRWGLWLALIVCGVLLMAMGYLMKDKE